MDQEIKPIKILVLAITIGAGFFMAIALILEKMGTVPFGNTLPDEVSYVVSFVTIAAIALSYFMFNRTSASYVPGSTNKTDVYRAAVIRQYAFMEAPALLNVIFYMLTANKTYLILFALCFLLMIFKLPSEDKYERFGQ
jgi:Na+-driven multidrug efflux pump